MYNKCDGVALEPRFRAFDTSPSILSLPGSLEFTWISSLCLGLPPEALPMNLSLEETEGRRGKENRFVFPGKAVERREEKRRKFLASISSHFEPR